MSTNISIFKKSNHTKGGDLIPIDVFLDRIKEGKWQDIVLPIRTIKDKAQRTEAKKNVPYVTLSGVFEERKNSGLKNHSGFIGIDIDDVDPEEVKSRVRYDRYVYAAFTSISGFGLCLLFKINGEKHAEAFESIQEYLFTNYEIVVDSAARDVSRSRFISYDPHIYINEQADKFTQYAKKKKAETKVPDVIFVQNDFDHIVNEICTRRIDITGGYAQWLSIAYGLADKFGEGGRDYFHLISQFSHLYKYELANRQYTECLKQSSSSRRATIGTVYYLAKQAGLPIVSEKTKLISQTAYLAKKGRRNKQDTIKLLQEAEGINPEESQPIVDQVFDNNIEIHSSDSPIDALETWLKQNYELRRNAITRKIENNGTDVEEEDLNSIFIAAKKAFDKDITSEIFNKLVFSRFISDFNPFLEFFEKYNSRKPKGLIEKLFECIETDTGFGSGEFCPDYKVHFGRKWLVGMISAMHGKHSPLMLVLSGNKQGTGKTEFWNRLLPEELKKYFAESKLDRGKDDEILMTQKLLILDDEMGVKDDREIAAFKRITSKQTFSLRAPYGKHNIDLKRLAVLCGTTNENEILSDPTGNRRVIPINVISLNHAQYNSIDKVDLIMEAYWLFKDGFKWELTSEDVAMLNENTGYFEKASPEYDLITKYFEIPERNDDPLTDFLTATEIKSQLESRSGQKLNSKNLGMELKKLGRERIQKKERGVKKWGYYLIDIEKKHISTQVPKRYPD